jgi:hypothetical protein
MPWTCSRVRTTRHTAYEHHLIPAARVRVTYRPHPLCGQLVDVARWEHRAGGAIWLLIFLPDGSRAKIPAAWVDGADNNLSSEVDRSTAISAQLVRELTGLIEQLRVSSDRGHENLNVSDKDPASSIRKTAAPLGRRVFAGRRQADADRDRNDARRDGTKRLRQTSAEIGGQP